MGVRVAVFSTREEDDDVTTVIIKCPGCRLPHAIVVEAPELLEGDENEPTVHGAQDVLIDDRRCRFVVRSGTIKFFSDCDHDLAGQTVPLPAIG